MEDIGVGAGLAILGFWLFIALVVAGGIWDSIRKRDAQHETLRRMVESGQGADQALMDTLLGVNNHLDRDLWLGGVVLLFIAPGMAVLGWMLGRQYPEAWLPLLGVGGLILFISIGLLVASKLIGRWYQEADKPLPGLTKE